MGSHSGIIKVWDYERKEAVCSRVFQAQKIQCITYDPQGKLQKNQELCSFLYWHSLLTLQDNIETIYIIAIHFYTKSKVSQ